MAEPEVQVDPGLGENGGEEAEVLPPIVDLEQTGCRDGEGPAEASLPHLSGPCTGHGRRDHDQPCGRNPLGARLPGDASPPPLQLARLLASSSRPLSLNSSGHTFALPQILEHLDCEGLRKLSAVCKALRSRSYYQLALAEFTPKSVMLTGAIHSLSLSPSTPCP